MKYENNVAYTCTSRFSGGLGRKFLAGKLVKLKGPSQIQKDPLIAKHIVKVLESNRSKGFRHPLGIPGNFPLGQSCPCQVIIHLVFVTILYMVY